MWWCMDGSWRVADVLNLFSNDSITAAGGIHVYYIMYKRDDGEREKKKIKKKGGPKRNREKIT